MISIEYIAGFFDGEGYVFVARAKTDSPKSKVKCKWFLKVGINNKDINVLGQIAERYYGDCWIRKEQAVVGKREIYAILFRAKACRQFLQDIEPYLITKKKQAQLGMQFYDFMHFERRFGRGKLKQPITKSDVDKIEWFRNEIRRLNAINGKSHKGSAMVIPNFPAT